MEHNDFIEFYRAIKNELNPSELMLLRPCSVKWSDYLKAKKDATVKRTVGKTEAERDVRYFLDILKHFYSGYEYFNLQNVLEVVEEKIKTRIKNKLSNDKLMQIIYEEISPYINDGNLSMIAYKTYLNFYKGKVAYVADTILEEDAGELVFLKKCGVFLERERLKIGAVKKFLLPTLPDRKTHKKRYLIGVYTNHEVKNIEVLNQSIKLHRLKTDAIEMTSLGSGFEQEDILYLAIHSFNLDLKSKIKFDRLGYKARGKRIVIFNFINNSGGNIEFIQSFFNGLLGENFETLKATIEETHLKKFKYLVTDDTPNKKYDMPIIFILTNKSVASETEEAIEFINHLPGTIIIGGATSGTSGCKDIDVFKLPNSGILVNIPQTKVYTKITPGVGFMPHFWLDTNSPEEAILKWIGKERNEKNN